MGKVIFLDRDGTLNVDHGYIHKLEDWQWQPGAKEALYQLQQAGYQLVVVTNQSGIGHGLYTQADMEALHQHVIAELTNSGIALAAIAFCPHCRDGQCDCRKPRTGMIRQVRDKIGQVDYAQSWMIGDKLADVGFGKALKAKTALIRSTYWAEDDLPVQPDLVVGSLKEAADRIVTGNRIS